ncbi:MAG: Asp-tRNA(Asn)/Glu-tRNA(Gln) amidotransferase subunit GatC [Anaerolineales bacterium]|nr:Asp-tRNA(Asn)/Glu-tRNA(Gln) amidotransferase subunit GatC [Anaerolineales bacterium]
MSLTIAEVRHIANLARLQLTPDEERRYAEQLSSILESAARLLEVDTTQIPPTATVLTLRAPLRPDIPRPCPPREKILANAPERESGMFRVPPVLE